MNKTNMLKLRNIFLMAIVYLLLNIQSIFALPVEQHILGNDKYIELENNIQEMIKLDIRKDGIYIIKTSGVANVVLKMVDNENVEIEPIFIERDNNYFASYYLKANNNYFVKVKAETDCEIDSSKLWLFCLGESYAIKYLNDVSNYQIETCGQDIYFKFIPQNTNTYIIKSYGKLDLDAQIYDEYGKKIAESSGLSGLNFKIIKELEKEKCYYIRVYSQNDIGIFDIEIQKDTSNYVELIDMCTNNQLDEEFYGYIKNEQQQNFVKFIPDIDGEYKFVVISDMDLDIDVLDIVGESVAQDIENNKNYSFAVLQAKKGREYSIAVSSKANETGMYKLRVLRFAQLREYANPIVQGINEVSLQDKEEYFKFRCPDDGIFNFGLVGGYNINLELYDENGKCIKEGEECIYITAPTIGGLARKNDTLYLKVVRTQDILKEECEIHVNNFQDLIKDCVQVEEGEVQGNILEKGNEVFYQFVPKQDGIYFIKSICKMYIDGKLYDDMGNLLSENSSDNMQLFIARRLKKNHTYYIQISDLYKESTGDFAIEISLYNDKENYSVIGSDIELEDEIEYLGDRKCYEFKASGTDVYTISLTSKSNMCFSVSDNCEDEIVSEESKYSNLRMDKDSQYKITVFGQDELNDVGEYVLSIENFSDKVRNAKVISEGEKYQGNLIVKDTQDCYTFSPKDEDYYCIYTTGDVNTYIEVYTDEGELIKTADSGFDSNFYLVMNLEKDNKYLFKIGGRKPNEVGIYELNIEKSLSQNPNKIQWLRLNDVTTDVLENDKTYKIYKFIVGHSGEYFIDNYSEINVDIELCDKTEEVLKCEDNKCSDNHKCYKLDENNLYYIKIKPRNGELGVYNIKIENVTKVYDGASSIKESKTKSGNLLKKWQTDYYKFEPYNTGDYLIAQMEGEEVCIEVFDQDGNIINTSTIADIINRAVFEYGNTYYIRIRNKYPIYSGEYEFFIISVEDLANYSEEFFQMT